MSTPKIIGIVAVIIFIFLAIVGTCVYNSSTDTSTPAGVTPVTASDRLSTIEQQYADLARELQTLQQENDRLTASLAANNSEIQRLESIIKRLQRENT